MQEVDTVEQDYQADRVFIMELIKRLADQLQELSSADLCQLPKICGQIKELSDDMISILYEDAEWHGVSAEQLRDEVLNSTSGGPVCVVDRALECSQGNEVKAIASSNTLDPQPA